MQTLKRVSSCNKVRMLSGHLVSMDRVRCATIKTQNANDCNAVAHTVDTLFVCHFPSVLST